MATGLSPGPGGLCLGNDVRLDGVVPPSPEWREQAAPLRVGFLVLVVRRASAPGDCGPGVPPRVATGSRGELHPCLHCHLRVPVADIRVPGPLHADRHTPERPTEATTQDVGRRGKECSLRARDYSPSRGSRSPTTPPGRFDFAAEIQVERSQPS